MKRCSHCRKMQPLSAFSKNRASADGAANDCLVCHRASCAKYRVANREFVRTQNAAYRAQNPEKIRIMKRVQSQNVRDAVFGHYGMSCACCGEPERAFLAIDHIGGGGNKHRKETGNRGGTKFYRWLRRNGFPEGFRTLCHNCNMAMTIHGTCPHQRVQLRLVSGGD